MTVYVESNFVLENALGQEDADPATTILELAEQGSIEIAFPTLAVTEPFSTISQRGRERRRLRSSLNEQVRELGRSKPHQRIVSMLGSIPAMLPGIEQAETTLLASTVQRLLAVGRVLPMDSTAFDRALKYRSRYDLSVQDAIVYASVIADLERQPWDQARCFVSKNWKDFGDPDIVAELQSFRCAYAEAFASALVVIAGWGIAS